MRTKSWSLSSETAGRILVGSAASGIGPHKAEGEASMVCEQWQAVRFFFHQHNRVEGLSAPGRWAGQHDDAAQQQLAWLRGSDGDAEPRRRYLPSSRSSARPLRQLLLKVSEKSELLFMRDVASRYSRCLLFCPRYRLAQSRRQTGDLCSVGVILARSVVQLHCLW